MYGKQSGNISRLKTDPDLFLSIYTRKQIWGVCHKNTFFNIFVIVIPKEGLSDGTPPDLLLVWHYLILHSPKQIMPKTQWIWRFRFLITFFSESVYSFRKNTFLKSPGIIARYLTRTNSMHWMNHLKRPLFAAHTSFEADFTGKACSRQRSRFSELK